MASISKAYTRQGHVRKFCLRETAAKKSPLNGTRGCQWSVAGSRLFLRENWRGNTFTVGYFSLDLRFVVSSQQCPTVCLDLLGTHSETRSALNFTYSFQGLKLCRIVLTFSVTPVMCCYTSCSVLTRKNKDLCYVYEYFATCVPGAFGCQKRVSDSLVLVTDGCKPPRGCWKLDLGPLEEQLVFLTSEP